MFNPPEFYQDLGRLCAEARNEGDEARALFHARHFRAAREYEVAPVDREDANNLYNQAYREARRT